MLELPPDHLVHHTDVALDDADDLCRDVLIDVVGHGDAGVAVADEGDGNVYALQEALCIDAREDEAAFVESFRALGGGADADGWEGVADAGEEATLLGQGAGVGHHAKGVHLEAVVVVETEGFVLNDARVQLEARSLQALAGTRMAGIQNGHIVLLGHLVDGVKQRQKVLLGVDVLLAVGAQKNVLSFLKAQPGMNVRSLNLRQIVMQHLSHRGASHIRTFLGQSGIGQIPAGVLGICHIDVGDDVHNAPIGLLRQALVLTPVAGLHVEDRNMQPLGADDAQAGIGIPQHQDRIRLNLNHQLVTFSDDIAHRLAEVLPHSFHIHIRVREFQVLEKHAVQVIIVILPGVCQQAVEVLTTFIDHSRQADDFRACADDDEKLKLPVILELCHIY